MRRKMKSLVSLLACCFLIMVIGFSSAYAVWITDGVAIAPVLDPLPTQPQITSDGSGGSIITWQDYRGGSYDIYAQRVDASGVVQWMANGVAVCRAGYEMNPQIVSDGSGGAIITWQDYRAGSYDIYAQRVNASGVVQWMTDGIAVCTAGYDQTYPQIVSDGSGGAIVTWWDYRGGSTWDIYAQRVNASGVVQWMTDGIAVCTAG